MTWLTYLPKTTGLPFGPRLQARAEKGRVFGMHGEDPIIPLVVDTATSYDASNVYTQEETISATSATYTGGHAPITRRTRMQIREVSTDSWTNKPWHINEDVVSDLLDRGGQVRFQTRAEDADGQSVVSNTGIKNVAWLPLVATQNPTISGIAAAGEDIIGTKAVYTGGKPPIEVQSQIQISDTGTGGWSGVDAWGSADAGTHRINTGEVGKYFRVAGRGIDSTEDGVAKAETTMSFSDVLGPVIQYDIGTLSMTVNGVAWAEGDEPTPIELNGTAVLIVSNTGNSPNIKWSWTNRGTTDVRITEQGTSATVIFQEAGFAQIQVDAQDNYASDAGQSFRAGFLVS